MADPSYKKVNAPVCWGYNELVFDSFDMQTQKNDFNHQKILFLKDGKLTQETDISKMSGEIKLLDSSSLTCITGSYQNGFCPKAEVISLNPTLLHNIQVEIKSNGEVGMGGSAVQERNFEGFVYEGGYHGYRRWGYGRTEEMVCNRMYDQHCHWDGLQQICSIIKEHENSSNKVTSIIFTEKIEDNQWIETTVMEKQGRYIKKVQNSQGLKEGKEISSEDYQKEISKGLEYKQTLMSTNKQVKFMAPLRENPLRWIRYDEQDLKAAYNSKLSYELCQVYLQYLFCQPQTHTTKPTAILSVNVADLLYQRRNKVNVDDRLKWWMQSFKEPFDLFGGFWKRIIVPLVLTDVYRHFSFVMIDFDPIRCTYFDSASFEYAKFYEQLIKDFIITQKRKNGKNGSPSNQQKINFTIFVDFPAQSDEVSCGYFMLQGIQQMVNYEKVTFQGGDLPNFKQKILKRLQLLL